MEAAVVRKKERLQSLLNLATTLQKRESSQWHFQNLHKSFKKRDAKNKNKNKSKSVAQI